MRTTQPHLLFTKYRHTHMKTKKVKSSRAITFSIPNALRKDIDKLENGTKSSKVAALISSTVDDYKKDVRFQRGDKSTITLSLPLDVCEALEGLDRSALLTELLNSFEVD